MKSNPLPISGPWHAGFTLDAHTISAEFLGYDLQGRPQFDTTRSEIGEALYQCKYRGERAASQALAAAAAAFVRERQLKVELVVPVPPSKVRSFQPLLEIARQLASDLKIGYDVTSVRKVKETEELKSVDEMAAREAALADAFAVDGTALAGRTVLLFDDLYRSGASMSAVARALTVQGRVAGIVALALTRTRSKS